MDTSRRRTLLGPVLAPIVAGIAGASALAGCLNGSGGGDGGGSIAGAWSLSQAGCRQSIAFTAEGGFHFGLSVATAGGTWRESVSGSYALSGASASSGAVEIEGVAPSKSGDVAYCAQWARRIESPFPADALSSALGESVGTYVFRQELSSSLGAVTIGTAPDRRDRVALYQEGGVLRGARLDGTPHYTHDLYAALPGDPVHAPVLPVATALVNMPDALYRETFNVTEVSPLALRILNVTEASDVTFTVESPGSATPRCRFLVFEDLEYTDELDPSPLSASAAVQTLRLNPADPGTPLVTFDADGMDAYLLPVAIEGIANGTCTVTIRAVSTVSPVLDAIRQGAGFEPLFELSTAAGPGYALGLPAGHREAPRRTRWWMGWGGWGLTGLPGYIGAVPALGEDAQGDAPDFDVLGLLGGEPAPLEAEVTGSGSARHLSLYGSGGGGLGPFTPAASGGAGQPVAVHGTFTAQFAAGQSRTYRITLDESARLALWSEGGLDTHALLTGPLAAPIGSDDDGSADGAGFRIVRTLEPGSHLLRVTAREAGAVTIHLEDVGIGPVPDEELEACLIANGLETLDVADWERLTCPSQDIASLEGLEDVAEFRVLELHGNRIADAAPLAALTELRVLSLADNLLVSTNGLPGLPRLHTLVLAFNPLPASALTALAPLADTLRLLDLTGVDSATGGTLVTLRTLLPVTAILDRDGNLVP